MRGTKQAKALSETLDALEKWLSSPAGQASLEEISHRVDRETAESRRRSYVEPELLREPVTV